MEDHTSGKHIVSTTKDAMKMSSCQVQDNVTREEEFKQFDVVTNFSDHYYSNRSKIDVQNFTSTSHTAYKKIMKEWKILEHDLPERIYVRAYEARIDLLRAVIIGAPETPYHDGLFFFDIYLPSDYPKSPPKVNYRSYGLCLNPNLLDNGRVCLSLLNTWTGKKVERWNTSNSTILQVLVSLQGLVLNEKPYFNEPVLKPARNWEEYNMKVFQLTCKSMIYLLRNPPKNFEAFVSGHFRDRAENIVRACEAYKDGLIKIGYYRDDHLPTPSKRTKVSRKFNHSMDKLIDQLLQAFALNGTHLEKSLEEPIMEENRKEHKVVNKIIGKLKCVLGLNKTSMKYKKNATVPT